MNIKDFAETLPITKGWSGDKKYCVTKQDGTKYLLRISPIEQYDRKKNELHMMEKVAALGIPMCRPIEFTVCEDEVYFLQSWINGKDADEIIPYLPQKEQYSYGLESGVILKKYTPSLPPKYGRTGKPDLTRRLTEKCRCILTVRLNIITEKHLLTT